MADLVVYQQVNKDHAYWTEKRSTGELRGGHTSGLLTHIKDGEPVENILFDVGMGTIEGIHDLPDFSWAAPLTVFITHSHIDHHAELMLFSELWCKRMASVKRGPIDVWCTGSRNRDTAKRLYRDHGYGFGGGGTLRHIRIPLGRGTPLGRSVFTVTAIPNDHVTSGGKRTSVNFLVKFGDHKLFLGWDMRTPPDRRYWPMLDDPSLALIEANTWETPKRPTGHTSVEELVSSGFLAGMHARIDRKHFGFYFVHYGGAEDPDGTLPESELEWKFRADYPGISGFAGVARRGQRWAFKM